MTPCALCGHLRTAHLQPHGDCRSCPTNDPCPGYDPEPDPQEPR